MMLAAKNVEKVIKRTLFFLIKNIDNNENIPKIIITTVKKLLGMNVMSVRAKK